MKENPRISLKNNIWMIEGKGYLRYPQAIQPKRDTTLRDEGR